MALRTLPPRMKRTLRGRDLRGFGIHFCRYDGPTRQLAEAAMDAGGFSESAVGYDGRHGAIGGAS